MGDVGGLDVGTLLSSMFVSGLVGGGYSWSVPCPRSLKRKKVQRANALKGKCVDVRGVFPPPNTVGVPVGPNKWTSVMRATAATVNFHVEFLPTVGHPGPCPGHVRPPTARSSRCSFLKHPIDRLRFHSTSGPFSGVVRLFKI